MGLRTWLGIKKKNSLERAPFYNVHSFSQLQQDRWVLSELANKNNGFFVEIGAFDGKKLSNTYLLEKEFGWTGILVEPNPTQHQAIRSNRSAVLDTRPVDASSGVTVTMRFVSEAPELSSMASKAHLDKHAEARSRDSIEIDQETVSLVEILERHNSPKDIDYISIDTEGNEFDILSTFDFLKYRVNLFSIEHNNTSAEQKIDYLMNERGYTRVFRQLSQFDAWYKKRA